MNVRRTQEVRVSGWQGMTKAEEARPVKGADSNSSCLRPREYLSATWQGQGRGGGSSRLREHQEDGYWAELHQQRQCLRP
jgi:hypothetical protein